MLGNSQDNHILSIAKEVIQAEVNSLNLLVQRLGMSFANSISLLLNCRGKAILTGVGKSSHIAQKIASTFASTGTHSVFIHPTEASHGDLVW
jgi:D-arabinose 5-phosphate isomerase GutQ